MTRLRSPSLASLGYAGLSLRDSQPYRFDAIGLGMHPNFNLHQLLATLARKRPIFHSEADFQHAFAWEVQLQNPNAQIRLEYRPNIPGTKMYIDAWIVVPNAPTIAIELKYKTRQLDLDLNGEAYRLLNQSAQDQGRYDFLADVARIESITSINPKVIGAAVLLTNDSSYWTAPRSRESVDFAFRLHEGRSVSGELAWAVAASRGTKRGRESAINLSSPYTISWSEYSDFQPRPRSLFRYLAFKVIRGKIRGAT